MMIIGCDPGLARDKTCGDCEYFDGEFGDCLSHDSVRFQTTATTLACLAFFNSGDATDEFDDREPA